MPFTPYVAMRDSMSIDRYSLCDVRATLLLTTAYHPTDGGGAGVRDGRVLIPPDTTIGEVLPSCT